MFEYFKLESVDHDPNLALKRCPSLLRGLPRPSFRQRRRKLIVLKALLGAKQHPESLISHYELGHYVSYWPASKKTGPFLQGKALSWTPEALNDLLRIKHYFERGSERDAQRVVSRIKSAVQQLRGLSTMGFPGFVFGTKSLLVSNLPFSVSYQVEGGDIVVLRLLYCEVPLDTLAIWS